MRKVTSTPRSHAAGRVLPSAGYRLPFTFRTVEVSLDASSPAARLFDGPNSVYLSPHHDDVCFSLGGLIRRRPGGRLISLFTRSKYSLNPPMGESPDIDAITRLRTAEDDAFAAASHLNKIDLGLADAPLLGRHAMDLSGSDDDQRTLTGPLLARLKAIAAETQAGERLTLFCPAGIGGHANHVATMRAIVGALPMLTARYNVLFYEDLHYAANPGRRETGLLRLFGALGGRSATRLVVGFNAQAKAKLALVRLYRSQFRTLPESCMMYSPRVPGDSGGLHEAVWNFGFDAPSMRPQIARSAFSTAVASAERVPDRAGVRKADDAPSPPMRPEKWPRSTGRPFGPPDTVEGLLTETTGRLRSNVRVDLSAIRRSAAVGTPELVSCVMLTAGRPLQARIAIECFRRQSWPRRQLVIVDTGTETSLEDWVRSLDDPAINFKRLPRGGATLGGLRNLATDRARGDFVCVWDDDDLHHPMRIEAQMTALTSTGAAACLLGRLFIWWPGRRELAASSSRAWEGTLLCRRDAMPRYDAEDRSEDTPAVTRLIARERIIRIDAPELYVYVRHATNTWSEPHFEGNFMRAVRRLAGQQYNDALARMATIYPLAEYLDAISANTADRVPPAATATVDIGQSPEIVRSIG